MKSRFSRGFFGILAVFLLGALLAGCATTQEYSDQPWNQAQPWEGVMPMPGMDERH